MLGIPGFPHDIRVRLRDVTPMEKEIPSTVIHQVMRRYLGHLLRSAPNNPERQKGGKAAVWTQAKKTLCHLSLKEKRELLSKAIADPNFKMSQKERAGVIARLALAGAESP